MPSLRFSSEQLQVMDTVSVETKDPENTHIHLIKLAARFLLTIYEVSGFAYVKLLLTKKDKWALLWQLYQRLAVAFLSVQQPYKDEKRSQIKPPRIIISLVHRIKTCVMDNTSHHLEHLSTSLGPLGQPHHPPHAHVFCLLPFSPEVLNLTCVRKELNHKE